MKTIKKNEIKWLLGRVEKEVKKQKAIFATMENDEQFETTDYIMFLIELASPLMTASNKATEIREELEKSDE